MDGTCRGQIGTPFAARAAMGTSGAPLGRRILVVDDNEDAAYVASELLRLQGHVVTVALDGPAALAAFAELRPDMVILDINMPGMSGYDVAREMRLLAGPSSPLLLVALTARHTAADVALAFEAGFDHHIAKPTTDLVDRVDRLFTPLPSTRS